MRYIELFGLIDDIFAKYRKEEGTPDSEWTPYCYYKNLTEAKSDYSVYCGAVVDELNKLLEEYQKDQNIQFTEGEWALLSHEIETANVQNNDNDAWTDIMFRSKYHFLNELRYVLSHYKVDG
jgi:hypothetical protein